MEKILGPKNDGNDGSGIKDLIILLNEEITAINDGNLNHVADLYEQKASLLERLEAVSPVIEAELKADTGAAKNLRSDLTKLHELIQIDAQLLANMTEATREIITEIARVRGRHSLDGVYSSTGETRPKVVSLAQQIDRTV